MSSMCSVARQTTVGAQHVQGGAVLEEGPGVELGDLPDGLALLARALQHLVLALVRVAGQVPDVGHVHDVPHLVAQLPQGAHQQVLGNVGAQVAEVSEVVDRGAAGVHPRPPGLQRVEILKLPGEGIEEPQGPVTSFFPGTFRGFPLHYRRAADPAHDRENTRKNQY